MDARAQPPRPRPYYIELYGGRHDGRIISVTAAIMRSQKLMVARDQPLSLPTPDGPPIPVAVSAETWVWDETVTPEGYYRFRRAR